MNDDSNDNTLSSECLNSKSESSGTSVLDLGCIKTSMTPKEVCDAIGKLDDGQKYVNCYKNTINLMLTSISVVYFS